MRRRGVSGGPRSHPPRGGSTSLQGSRSDPFGKREESIVVVLGHPPGLRGLFGSSDFVVVFPRLLIRKLLFFVSFLFWDLRPSFYCVMDIVTKLTVV